MTREGDVASPSNYVAVTGTLGAVGRRVQVYVDEGDVADVAPGVLREVVATFDEHVFPRASRSIGQARDSDGDGRFTILMSSRLTRLGGGRHAVDGFARNADFEPGLAAPFSNHGDMMYLSTALRPGPHLRTVLAHEYTHAVTYSAKSVRGATPVTEEEGWLDEGLAHLVEDDHGFSRSNLDYRVSAFLSDPARYRLVVEDYYAADLFRSHGNRGASYLFLRWCADRYGPALVPSLIRSEGVGVKNLESATGTSFEGLFREWSVALFLSGFDPSGSARVGLDTIDLRNPLGGWELAGPKTETVTPGGPVETWNSPGTAARFLVVESSPTGAVEVNVAAEAGAAVQVTALPLPDDLAALTLSVREAPGPAGRRAFLVRLEERRGTPVRVTGLAWEPLVPGPDPHAPVFRRGGLDPSGVLAAFGTDRLPARGRLDSKPIPTAGAFPLGSPLVVKVVGTDARGRRVSGWARVPTGEVGDGPGTGIGGVRGYDGGRTMGRNPDWVEGPGLATATRLGENDRAVGTRAAYGTAALEQRPGREE